MVDIFADEGISGTSTEKRTEFKRMIEDCKAGKIDMVDDKVNDMKDGLKQRFDEILETINSRDSLLEEFDEEYLMRWLRRLKFSRQRILFLS